MLRSLMGGRRRVFALLGSVSVTVVLAVSVIGTPVAVAQATRTWVSGVGDDANPCSRTAPCKTFPGAISKTAAGGEINCLDSGGFGTVTITKSISIICDGVIGGILAAGTNGVNVNAGPTDVVTLRGLDIEGVGSGTSGLAGIKFNSGAALHVQNTTIRDFRGGEATGISIANSTGVPEITVTDTAVENNGTGGTGGAIMVKPSGSAGAQVTLTRVLLSNSVQGLKGDGTGNSGGISMTVTDSVASHNGNGGFAAITPVGGGTVKLMIRGSTSTFNGGSGVVANGTGTVARVGTSIITGNGIGTNQTNGGVVESYQTNEISSNTSDGTRTNITGE